MPPEHLSSSEEQPREGVGATTDREAEDFNPLLVEDEGGADKEDGNESTLERYQKRMRAMKIQEKNLPRWAQSVIRDSAIGAAN